MEVQTRRSDSVSSDEIDIFPMETPSVRDIQLIWGILVKKLEDYEDAIDLHDATVEIMELDSCLEDTAHFWLKEKMTRYQQSLLKVTSLLFANVDIRVFPDDFFDALINLSFLCISGNTTLTALPPSINKLEKIELLCIRACPLLETPIPELHPSIDREDVLNVIISRQQRVLDLKLSTIIPSFLALHYLKHQTPTSRRRIFADLSPENQSRCISAARKWLEHMPEIHFQQNPSAPD